MPLSFDQLREIVDGDTVRLKDGTKVRTTGFDAPELSHPESGIAEEPGARLSRANAERFFAQGGVTAPDSGSDVYGRTLADPMSADGETLAEDQLSRGLGFPSSGMNASQAAAFDRGLSEMRNPSTREQADINAQLREQWMRATPQSHFNRVEKKRGLGSVFTDALSRGMDQMGMMAGGTKMLLGQMTGIDALEQSGIKQARENQIDIAYNRPDVGTLANVDNVGDAVTWAVEKLGEQGPNLAAMLGTAAATGGVGWVAESMAARLAGEKLATQAASSALKFAAKGMTGEVGAALAGGTLNIGETKLELDTADPGGDHNLLALGTGLLKTSLDVFSLKQMPGVGRIFASQGSRLGLSPRQAIEAFGDIPAAMLRSSVIEGGTEGLQTVLDEAAKSYKTGLPFTKETWANIGESAATGAFMGGVMGGGGGVAELGINNMLKPPDPNAPPPPALGAGTPPPAGPAPAPEARAAATDRLAQLSAIDPNDLTQEQQSERYALERTLGMADSEEWGGQPPPPPPGGTTAEPLSDIAAQTAAVADPSNPKTAQWIADGDGAQARIDAAIAQGLQVLTLSDGVESGTLLSRDPQVLQSAREAFDMGASISAINERLVYGGIPEGSKERAVEAAAAGEQPVVQQNTDAAGNVITEAASTQADAPAVSAALDAQLGEGESRNTTTVEGAQERRLNSGGIRPAAPRPGVRVNASGAVDYARDTNANLAEPGGPVVGPQTTAPGSVGSKAEHIDFKQRSEADADAAQQAAQSVARQERTAFTDVEQAQMWAELKALKEARNKAAERASQGNVEEASAQEVLQQEIDSLSARIYQGTKQEVQPAKEVPRGTVMPVDAQGNSLLEPSAPSLISRIRRFISGGNTGGDQGGLLAGRDLGLETGGTAPKGFRTSNGPNPGLADFGLTEHSSASYVPRTIQNVMDSNVTIAFIWGPSVGTSKTIGYAQTGKWLPGTLQTKLDGTRPVIVVTTKNAASAVAQIQRELAKIPNIAVVNIAGHRENSQPGIENFVRKVLVEAGSPEPNSTTMVPTAEGIAPQNPPKQTAVPAGGTLVTYGKPDAPAKRAISIVTGNPIQDRITRVAEEGKAKKKNPIASAPKEGSGLQRLEMRLRALPYVKRLMLGARRESAKVQTASGKITVADRNDQIINLVRDALFAHLDSVHGIESPSERQQGTSLGQKFGALLHQIVNHVSDKDLDGFVEAAHNDNRNVLNAIGRPLDNLGQDKSVGQAQQGRTIQDDDGGRAPDREEYAGEEIQYEEGFNQSGENANQRKQLREFIQKLKIGISEPALLDKKGEKTGKRWTAPEQFMELRRNPIFRNDSPAQIAAQFNRWHGKTGGSVAEYVEAAHRAYQENPAQWPLTAGSQMNFFTPTQTDVKMYDASSTAARQFESAVAADPAAYTEQRMYERDIVDFGVENDLNNAIDLSPEQAAFDKEQQADRVSRGYAPQKVASTERQVARLRSTIANKVDLESAENDGLLEDPTTRPDVRQPVTLSERLFAGLADLADTMEGMRNKTGTVKAAAFVDTLIKLGKPSKVMRLVLTALKPFLAKTTLVFSDTATEAGQFDPATGTITLDSRRQTGEMVHVFLHEAFHAATYNGLRNNAIFNGRMTRMRERAILALKTTKINEADRQEIEYGLQNNDEFVAQLFSSPAFLNFLESIPVERKTLLRKILNEIGNLLGLANNTTLAAAAMEDVLFEIAKGPQALDNTGAAVINAPNLRAAASSVVTAAQNASVQSVTRAITEGTPKALNWMMHSFEAVQTSYRQVVLNLSQVMPKARAELYARRIKSFSDRLKTAQGINGAKVGASIEAVAKRLSMTQDEAAAEIATNWTDLEARNAMAPADRPPLTATQVVIKQFFDEMAAYIEGAGVKGFSRNTDDPGQVYLPQIYDKDAIKANKAGAIQLLVGMRIRDPVDNEIKVLNDTTAAGFIEGILSEHERGVNGDIPWAGSLKRRTLIDPRAQQALRDAGFLHKDAGIIMTYYASSVTKQAEFERTFGGWVKMMSVDRRSGEALETSVFSMAHGLIRKTINGLYGTEFTREQASTKVPAYLEAIERARRDGLLQRVGRQYKVWQRDYIYQRQLVGSGNPQVDKRIQLVFAGIMGNLGADMNPKWRRTQQWLMAAQAVTTLAFSTVSSIVEAGIHPAMAPSFNSMVGAVKRQMNSADREVTQRLLRMLGLAGEHAANIALNDSSQMDVPNLPRVILEKFFKLNFQHQWTQMMRGIAVDTVISRLQEVRDTNNAEAAAELGLELSAIEHWLDNGMPVTGDTSAPHPVALAVRKFIDERVIMPDAISLPVFMNDPRFGLISQLKRFMYAYGHFIIGPLAERTAASYAKARAAGRGRAAAGVLASSRIALLGVATMPLALLAGEMKDFLKYRVWGYPPPAFRDKEGLAAWVEVTRKSGFLGPVDLAVNLFDDQSGGFAALAGPTASHLDVALEHGFMSEQFLRRSTPVAGQLPGLWKWMAEDDGY